MDMLDEDYDMLFSSPALHITAQHSIPYSALLGSPHSSVARQVNQRRAGLVGTIHHEHHRQLARSTAAVSQLGQGELALALE